MAVDLFVNFERAGNGSAFYRNTTILPYTFTLRLSDLNNPNANYDLEYIAEISFNRGPFTSLFQTTDGTYEQTFSFDCSTECISTINVWLIGVSNPTFFKYFELSAVFLNNIPTAEFITYPQYVPYVTTAGFKDLLILSATNYFQSLGTSFYGENHTEHFHLSCSNEDNPSLSSLWFVGNTIDTLLSASVNKPSSVFTLTAVPGKHSAYVDIYTTPELSAVYLVSLMVIDQNISQKSPIITYDDVTGESRFYPYFTSTIDITGGSSLNHNLKDSIKVLPYPPAMVNTFGSPFFYSQFTLPTSLTPQYFLSHVSIPAVSAVVLTEQFIGTYWSIKAESGAGIWGGIGDALTNTPFLSNIYAYNFELAYDTTSNYFLDYFRASPLAPTTITVNTSALKYTSIDMYPYDWRKRIDTQSFQASAIISPLPFTKIYTPNYFNIIHQPVRFDVIIPENSRYRFNRIEIKSEKSSDTIIITNSPLSGHLTFNDTGVIDLHVFVIATNYVSGQVSHFGVKIDNMIEIVERYDTVDPTFYQTDFTNIDFPYIEYPRLTPNEWVTEDNINSVLKKLYETCSSIETYTKLYEKKTCLYGWTTAKLFFTNNQELAGEYMPVKTFSDLECPPEKGNRQWASMECPVDQPNGFATWTYHTCDTSFDPTCNGKYCLEWKWNSRKRASNPVWVTWRLSKCKNRFAKKWKFERCELEPPKLNCDPHHWLMSNTDPGYFPFSACATLLRCTIKDVQYIEKTDQLVAAFGTELQLYNLDYHRTFVSRKGINDDMFPFENIVAIDSTKEGELFVLDQALSVVSVFKIFNNKINLFTTWGRFGYKMDPIGLNDPKDIHLDPMDTVWVADTGNGCVKKFTFNGTNLGIFDHELFLDNPPLSMCVDSSNNVHVLITGQIVVLDYNGNFLFTYNLTKEATSPKKINSSYNREMVYVVYDTGIVKFFKTGRLAYYIVNDHKCKNNKLFNGFGSITQDRFRNLYVTAYDKIFKVPDLMNLVDSRSNISKQLFWSLNDVLVHKEEYVQPWVYLRSFHRIWDNIELLRSSLFYEPEGCKKPTYLVHDKKDITIGQNEIVSNAVVNRIALQLWENVQTVIKYFDPDCQVKRESLQDFTQCSISNTTVELSSDTSIVKCPVYPEPFTGICPPWIPVFQICNSNWCDSTLGLNYIDSDGNVIYYCTPEGCENRDDNFEIYFNGYFVGKSYNERNVPSVFIGSANTMLSVQDPDFSCPMDNANVYHFDSSYIRINQENLIYMQNIKDNGCNNYGIVSVRFYLPDGNGLVEPYAPPVTWQEIDPSTNTLITLNNKDGDIAFAGSGGTNFTRTFYFSCLDATLPNPVTVDTTYTRGSIRIKHYAHTRFNVDVPIEVKFTNVLTFTTGMSLSYDQVIPILQNQTSNTVEYLLAQSYNNLIQDCIFTAVSVSPTFTPTFSSYPVTFSCTYEAP